MTMEELYAAFQQKRAAAARPTTPAVAAPVDKPADEARQPCLGHTGKCLQPEHLDTQRPSRHVRYFLLWLHIGERAACGGV
jgi:hypothetical protein